MMLDDGVELEGQVRGGLQSLTLDQTAMEWKNPTKTNQHWR